MSGYLRAPLAGALVLLSVLVSPAVMGQLLPAVSPEAAPLADRVSILMQTDVATAIPLLEPQPIDLRIVSVPGVPASLTRGVRGKAYTRYVEVEGRLIGQAVLAGVERSGRIEALSPSGYSAQFDLAMPELEPSASITIEGDRAELVAALQRLAETPATAAAAAERPMAEAPAAAASTPGSNAPQNTEAASYRTPAPLDVAAPAAIPVVRVTTEGCAVRVDLQQLAAIQQARVETTEEGSVTTSACEDGADRFPIHRSYSACADHIDMEARLASAQFRLYYTDAGGGRVEVSECAADPERAFPIIEQTSSCSVYLDYAAEMAVPQARLVYRNSNSAEVQVRGCEASAEVAAVPLSRDFASCTIRHDYSAARSYRQSRYTYELEGVVWQAGPCVDDGTEYAHASIYQTAAGQPVCAPLVNLSAGTVTHQSRIQILVEGQEQYLTPCTPDTAGTALIATVEGCESPATWTHDVAAGRSYGRERYYYMAGTTREYVTPCQQSTATYQHQVATAGWQHHDATRISYRLSTVWIDTPSGQHTILAGQVLPGAEEHPYTYQGEVVGLDGTSWYEGCTQYLGRAAQAHYLRPDGTSWYEAVGPAPAVENGDHCTVSSESRTVYAYTQWSAASDAEVGSGSAINCISGLPGCAWRAYYVQLPGGRSTTNGTHIYCRGERYHEGVVVSGGSMTHMDQIQTRTILRYPSGEIEPGAWTASGAPHVRIVIACY